MRETNKSNFQAWFLECILWRISMHQLIFVVINCEETWESLSFISTTFYFKNKPCKRKYFCRTFQIVIDIVLLIFYNISIVVHFYRYFFHVDIFSHFCRRFAHIYIYIYMGRNIFQPQFISTLKKKKKKKMTRTQHFHPFLLAELVLLRKRKW